ncbi:hypothetical protein B0H13DRAFT_2476602 [Mycena leptocephala]|nr:hypothetical protein B0H13DRAFT_2476602 [Mycena leptocephala]
MPRLRIFSRLGFGYAAYSKAVKQPSFFFPYQYIINNSCGTRVLTRFGIQVRPDPIGYKQRKYSTETDSDEGDSCRSGEPEGRTANSRPGKGTVGQNAEEAYAYSTGGAHPHTSEERKYAHPDPDSRSPSSPPRTRARTPAPKVLSGSRWACAHAFTASVPWLDVHRVRVAGWLELKPKSAALDDGKDEAEGEGDGESIRPDPSLHLHLHAHAGGAATSPAPSRPQSGRRTHASSSPSPTVLTPNGIIFSGITPSPRCANARVHFGISVSAREVRRKTLRLSANEAGTDAEGPVGRRCKAPEETQGGRCVGEAEESSSDASTIAIRCEQLCGQLGESKVRRTGAERGTVRAVEAQGESMSGDRDKMQRPVSLWWNSSRRSQLDGRARSIVKRHHEAQGFYTWNGGHRERQGRRYATSGYWQQRRIIRPLK